MAFSFCVPMPQRKTRPVELGSAEHDDLLGLPYSDTSEMTASTSLSINPSPAKRRTLTKDRQQIYDIQ